MDATHETFPQAVLDALTDHIAVLDANGVIVAVNAAWQRFARDNAASPLIASGVGLNYLEACRGAADRGDATAREALAGLQAVLAGDCLEFALEYPCHAPTEERWFRVRATPLQPPHRGVVVAHTNITPRKAAEAALHK